MAEQRFPDAELTRGDAFIRTASHRLCDAIHPPFNVSPTHLRGDAGDLARPNTDRLDLARRFRRVIALTHLFQQAKEASAVTSFPGK